MGNGQDEQDAQDEDEGIAVVEPRADRRNKQQIKGPHRRITNEGEMERDA